MYGTIDFNTLWQDTILSQYSNSPAIKSIIEGMSKLLDPSEDLKVFYDNIYNPTTCEGVGTKIWATIVAMANQNGIDVAQGEFFGFNTSPLVPSASSFHPYNQYPFIYDQAGSSRFQFTDASLRALVLAKALANITCATLPTLKKFMREILGSNQFAVDNLHSTAGAGGYVYVQVTPEEGDSPQAKGWYELVDGTYVLSTDTEVVTTKTYYRKIEAEMTVKFIISGTRPVTLQLFKLYAPVVVGAGVKIIYQATGASFFGFEGSELAQNFDNGSFYDETTSGWYFGEL